MRYLILMLLLCGCARDERSRALLQADQAVTAISKECVAPEPSIKKIDTLAKTAKVSIAPSLEDVKVDTTVEMAITETPKFVHKATLQAGKAHSESSSDMNISEGVEGLIFGVLSGLSPVLAIAAKSFYDRVKKTRQANLDQAAYAEEVTYAKTDEEIRAVQSKHYDRQMANGTHKLLYDKRKRT